MKGLLWILILVLSGFQNAGSIKQSHDLLSTKWKLLGLQHGDTKIYESIPAEFSGMNITFNNSHRFQAASSCNTIYGYYFISGRNSIKIDSLSMTKMFCVDSLQTLWEDKYITGLKNCREFEIASDTLSLMTISNGKLIFKAEPSKAESVKQK